MGLEGCSKATCRPSGRFWDGIKGKVTQAMTGRNETLRRGLFQKTLLPMSNGRRDGATVGSQRGT